MSVKVVNMNTFLKNVENGINSKTPLSEGKWLICIGDWNIFQLEFTVKGGATLIQDISVEEILHLPIG